MGSKDVLTAKVGTRTLERLDEYADREGISRSNAADRMIKQGLDVEESDMRLVPVRSDGGTAIEDQLNDLEANLQEDIENQDENFRNLISVLVIALIWMGIQTSVGLPDILVLTTGPVLIVLLIVSLLQYWRRL